MSGELYNAGTCPLCGKFVMVPADQPRDQDWEYHIKEAHPLTAKCFELDTKLERLRQRIERKEAKGNWSHATPEEYAELDRLTKELEAARAAVEAEEEGV